MKYTRPVLIKSCPTLLLLLSFVTASIALASERAHEHGVGTLSVAIEGHDVEIELIVPGSDVVGFEHSPSSKIEREAVVVGARSLRDVDSIVSLSNAAKCRIEKIEVTSGMMKIGQNDHGNKHKHKHEVTNKDDHIDEHKHKHEASNRKDQKEVHSEFISHYHFHCDNPKKLTGIAIGFFKTFPSAYELNVKWITPSGQGAKEMTANATSVTF